MVGEAEELYKKGCAAFNDGKTLDALGLFEKAFNMEPENPKYQSYLGLCIAFERGKIKEAVSSARGQCRQNPVT